MDDRTGSQVSSPPQNPHGEDHPLLKDAWQKGYEAGQKKIPERKCPFGDYPGKVFRTAWLEGWKAGTPAPPPRPAVVTRQVAVTRPGNFLPPGAQLPTHYLKTSPVPCPKCRRILLDDSGQAVLQRYTFGDIVTLLCQACGHSWRLPILTIVP